MNQYPIRVALVVPQGLPITESQIQQADAICRETMAEMKRWYERELGHTFDWVYELHRSPHPLSWFQTDSDGSYHGDPVCFRGGFGEYTEGVTMNRVLQGLCLVDWEPGRAYVYRPEWPQYEEPGITGKWVIFMLGAGGYAGGLTRPESEGGVALLGDWGMAYTITGQPAPCCVSRYGTTFCSPTPYNANASMAHEMLHAMGVDSHNPYIAGFGTFSEQQRYDITHNNPHFLRPVVAEPIPPPEVVTVASVTAVPTQMKVWLNRGADIRVDARYSDGTVVENVNATFLPGPGPGRVTVSATGWVTGVKKGSTYVTCEFKGVRTRCLIDVRRIWPF